MKTSILKQEIIKIFQKYGLNKDHAQISANALINAELVGAYGHGLSRLKMYCDRISKKVINPKPKIKIKKISQSISHIDANNSIGFIAADIGIKKAIDHAKKTGIGLVPNKVFNAPCGATAGGALVYIIVIKFFFTACSA